MEYLLVLKPSKPTTIEDLLKNREIYGVMNDKITFAYYLIYHFGTDNEGNEYYKSTENSNFEPIEKLIIRFAKAQLQYYRQQIQPSPSVNPEATNPKVENHK
jgi:hypothetical protein